MTVYKGYMKIVKQNKGIILLYLVIFFSVTMMFQVTVGKSIPTSYQAESIKIGIVDNDGGALSQSLKTYLEHFHNVSMLSGDKAVMQEKLFYRDIEYIIHIPSGFFDKCIINGQKLSVTKVPGSYASFYADQQINSFLNNVRTYQAAGFSEEEAALAARTPSTARITLMDTTGTAGITPNFVYYFRYIPYLFLSLLCYVMGNILSAFHKGDLPKRMRASSISVYRQNGEGLLAAATIAVVLWGITIAASLLMYHKEMLAHSGFIYYILNSLAMLLVALSISYLVGIVTTNSNMLSGIVNTIALGMCFLCGVFVPLEYMNSGVKTAARFLPVYWYEHINDLLIQFDSITEEVRTDVLQALGIQFVFAAAFVCIAMAISKHKRTV